MKDRVSILIVDDDPTMRTLLEKILIRDGYRVQQASDGIEALHCMETDNFEIVITDMKMPGMNGFDLLKMIKKGNSQTSVIIMTAYGDTFTVKDAMLLGADEYVTKPFKSHEISLVVERAYWRIISSKQQESI